MTGEAKGRKGGVLESGNPENLYVDDPALLLLPLLQSDVWCMQKKKSRRRRTEMREGRARTKERRNEKLMSGDRERKRTDFPVSLPFACACAGRGSLSTCTIDVVDAIFPFYSPLSPLFSPSLMGKLV